MYGKPLIKDASTGTMKWLDSCYFVNFKVGVIFLLGKMINGLFNLFSRIIMDLTMKVNGMNSSIRVLLILRNMSSQLFAQAFRKKKNRKKNWSLDRPRFYINCPQLFIRHNKHRQSSGYYNSAERGAEKIFTFLYASIIPTFLLTVMWRWNHVTGSACFIYRKNCSVCNNCCIWITHALR